MEERVALDQVILILKIPVKYYDEQIQLCKDSNLWINLKENR